MGFRESFAPGEIYHLYNRGTEKRKIFLSSRDYERFLALLYLSNSTQPIRIDNILRNEQGSTLLKKALGTERGDTLVHIGAYCLMPNHFHFLVKEKSGGGISLFMQKLATGYTMYFNKKYERSGALLQGKFKSRHAAEDRYLKYLISYIHLNPVQLLEHNWKKSGIKNRQGAEKFLHGYTYSSFLDFCKSDRELRLLLDEDALPNYFASSTDFKQNLRDWLLHREVADEQGSTLLI